MKYIYKIIFVFVLFFSFNYSFVYASESINLTIRNGSSIIYSDSVLMPEEGSVEIDGHTINSRSVLSLIHSADISTESFNISNLEYYESYGSFYLKCINNLCDNWQYRVDDEYSYESIDHNILSDGQNVYFYFGPQHTFLLSSDVIKNNEELVVSAKNYVYQNDEWEPLTSLNIGITVTDPNNPFIPIEINVKELNQDGNANFIELPVGSYQVGIKEDYYFPTKSLTVEEKRISSSGSYPNPSDILVLKKEFNLKKALEFLVSKQKEDGSFGSELLNDWVAIALSSSPDYTDAREKLINYFKLNKLNSNLLTDYERHIMALMSLKLNPYLFNSENYIKKIIEKFDGIQFGEKEQINDDIFALLVLKNAGYTDADIEIQETINFILSRQLENGSWNESVDLTSAGISALSLFNKTKNIDNSILSAKDYIKTMQKEDASWGNISSTSWVIDSIYSQGNTLDDWSKNGSLILDYFINNQDEEGNIKTESKENKIWITSYAVIALSSMNWDLLMNDFEKNKEVNIVKKENILEKVIHKIKSDTIIKENVEKTENVVLDEVKTNVVLDEVKTKVRRVNFFRRLFNKIFGFN